MVSRAVASRIEVRAPAASSSWPSSGKAAPLWTTSFRIRSLASVRRDQVSTSPTSLARAFGKFPPRGIAAELGATKVFARDRKPVRGSPNCPGGAGSSTPALHRNRTRAENPEAIPNGSADRFWPRRLALRCRFGPSCGLMAAHYTRAIDVRRRFNRAETV